MEMSEKTAPIILPCCHFSLVLEHGRWLCHRQNIQQMHWLILAMPPQPCMQCHWVWPYQRSIELRGCMPVITQTTKVTIYLLLIHSTHCPRVQHIHITALSISRLPMLITNLICFMQNYLSIICCTNNQFDKLLK